jgi:hypothetical protein
MRKMKNDRTFLQKRRFWQTLEVLIAGLCVSINLDERRISG